MTTLLPESEWFWARVDRGSPDECWPWQRACFSNGYGNSKRGGSAHNTLAHRRAWKLTYGDIPAGMQVCHRCDNRPCCNPGHLFLGTNRDNVNDMVSKGRHVSPRMPGESNPKAKLTRVQVDQMRRRYGAGGVTHKQLSAEYGICEANVSFILNAVTWRTRD